VQVNLSGKVNFRAVDHLLEFDFGTNGIGGDRNTSAGDGYYALAFDLDANGSLETELDFYRLLGNVNSDRIVDNLDIAAISAVLGRTGSNLDEDVNGDGVVNALDRTLASRARGRRLAAGLPLDD
jgi:hypothetical protein